MSQTIQGKNDWFKNNYDKLILLVLLLGLLVSCVLLIGGILAGKAEVQRALARVGLKGTSVELKDTKGFDQTLADARQAATAPHKLPAHVAVSDIRVACVKCGRPIRYEALECPFCLAAQPEMFDADKLDTDGDGIPDKIEIALGLDPQNSDDAYGDLDGDGFTNLEEFLANTDPKDPAKFPPPIVKLRVAGIRPVPFHLRFVSVSEFDDGKRFQLNLQSLERTYFQKLGDIVMGYKIDSYDPDAQGGETLILVRQADNRSVRLVKGRPVTEEDRVILFVSLLNRQPIRPPKRLHDTFEFDGKTYKVIDIKRDGVVIQNVQTQETVNVPMMTDAERRGGPQAQPQADASPFAGFP